MKSVYVIGALLAVLMISSCQKELTWCLDCPSTALLIKDLDGECNPIEIGGVFKVNLRTQPGVNYARLNVDVEQSGTYDIRTDTVNGVSFKAQGSFNSVGVTEVVLYPFGTPVNSGTFEYRVKVNATECNFSIDVIEDSASRSFISCLIGNDAQRTEFNFQSTGGLGGTNGLLSFFGLKTTNPNGSRFKAQVQVNSGSVLTNQDYTVNRQDCDVQAEYRDDAGVVYKALTSQGPVADNPFTIRLTNLTTTRRFGTFKGKMFKEGGSPVDTILIRDGRFEFPF